MPRQFAKVNVAIWQDPDFRRLPPAAQHLYLMLWTAPELSFCGTHDWRPNRLTHLSEGFTEKHTREVAACLSARHFLVVDEDTEEVLIRSWARFDEVLKQPRLAISYVSAYTATYSTRIRAVLVYEAKKMRELWPELTCWWDQRVAQMLEHEAISAKDLPTPEDPFGDGFAYDFGDGFALGLAQTPPKVWGSVSVPPTSLQLATASSSKQTERAGKPATARKRASSLSDDFEPNDTNRRLAQERGLNLSEVLAQFLDHHRAKGSTYIDWHAALNTWIRREKVQATGKPSRNLPQAHEIELPPDGLSPEEYAAWEREARARRQAR